MVSFIGIYRTAIGLYCLMTFDRIFVRRSTAASTSEDCDSKRRCECWLYDY